mmetsp:Transcript_6864/g.8167  ORF Transcript_6864/g.8167 Transcript_6864/m.8167 type:complete len:91 (-) Transcript_6864:79-351(-)
MEASEVRQIKFGTTDLVIEGLKLNRVTSKITPASQVGESGRPGQHEQPSCYSFGSDLLPTNSLSSIVPNYHNFHIKQFEVWYFRPKESAH